MARRGAVLVGGWLLFFDVLVSAITFVLVLRFREYLALAARSRDLPGWLAGVEMVGPAESLRPYYLLLTALIPVWALALSWAKTMDFRADYVRMSIRYARAVLGGVAVMALASYAVGLDALAPSFVMGFGAIQLSVLLVGRYCVIEALAWLRRRHGDGHRVIIVGCDATAVDCRDSLLADSAWNVHVLGHVDAHEFLRSPKAVPHLGSLDTLANLLDTMPVDEVVFAVPARDPGMLREPLLACEERGVDVLVALPTVFSAHGTVDVSRLTGFDRPLLGVRRTPTGELRLIAKRAMDCLGGALILIFAAPIMAAIALAIKITSPGPVLFKQVRVGRHGREFVLYKFRSMVIDAEARRKELMHLNEMDGPVFKIRKDPRITPIGGFIRRTSLDELPQLFNVMLGDMSLVGPRPPIPSEVAQYQPWQRRRLSVKPGLTGLWQVSGRNDVKFEEWMRMDLAYIDQWSLALDLKILIRTLPAVIARTGA